METSASHAVLLCFGLAFGFLMVDANTVRTQSLEEDVEGIIQELTKKIMPLASELAGDENLSPRCAASLMKTFMGLRTGDAWALRMILANGLVANNMMEFGFTNLGGYEQCLKTTVRSKDNDVIFKGQYCTLLYRLPYDFTINLIKRFQKIGEMHGRANMLEYPDDVRSRMPSFRCGICIPSACTQEEANFLASYAVTRYGANATVNGCRTADPKKVHTKHLISMVVLGLLFTFVALGTCVELCLSRRDVSNGKKPTYGTLTKVVLAFSAISNSRRLFNMQTRKGSEPLQFLNGLKFLMVLWVILGHTYIVNQLEYYHSIYKMWEITDQIPFQIVNNSFFSVATFFCMSGFTLTFGICTFQEELKRRNLIAVYFMACFRRYIRLVPPALVIVAIGILLPLVVDGPGDWDNFAILTASCHKNWWTVALAVVNWRSVLEGCLQHLWYISADLQIFVVVAMPLGLLFVKYPKFATVVAASVVISFCIIVSYQTYAWGLLFSFTTGSPDLKRVADTLEFIYFRPFAHVSTYVAGMIGGYLAFKHRNASINCRKQVLLWLTAIALSSFVIFVTTPWNRHGPPGQLVNALYGGFNRVVWAIAANLLLFACATGNGGLSTLL
ncbi:nose resistant to fluoxetine protein 6-like isoform X2 [Ornithodoros turicata]|uniref:nose resistant to fluoxetine protein 6-like isoform X2 n=1 Tax=Ornithodoros turicata TaxID=34597 RepID=UPI0031398DAD